MKLNEARPYLETSGSFEEQEFSIEDVGMLFDILRNKMYSDPILAIAREVSCNARDAHREVNKQDIPVEIQLPNALEPLYKIKDFGPGISPDRMSKVFLKYTASTKRGDNLQTGGYGLGAKTPFSYSDTFSIITIFNNVKYMYTAVIDESKVGKCMLVHEEPTDLPSGTEIIVPVLAKNFQDFYAATKQACKHWDVKPTIKGGALDWPVYEKILETKKWSIVKSFNYYTETKVIVDNIEYKLDNDILSKFSKLRLNSNLKGDLHIYFNVGELTLPSHREQIHLDDNTKNILKDRIADIEAGLKQIIKQKIDACPDYWSAHICLQKEIKSIFHSQDVFGPQLWNGLPVAYNALNINCNIFNFTMGGFKSSHDADKIYKIKQPYMTFANNTGLYMNDLGFEPTVRHLKKAFQDDLDLACIQIIDAHPDKLQGAINKYHLEHFNYKLLSNITKAPKPSKTSKAKLITYKFKSGTWMQVPLSESEKDTNKVICLLSKSGNSKMVFLKSWINNLTFESMADSNKDYSFYGVDMSTPEDRIKETFKDFINFETFVKDTVLLNFNAFEHYMSYSDGFLDDYNFYYNNLLKLINPYSDFAEYITLNNKYKDEHKRKYLLDLHIQVNGEINIAAFTDFKLKNPSLDLEVMEEKIQNKYPLFSYINKWDYSRVSQGLAQYINLIDKEENNV